MVNDSFNNLINDITQQVLQQVQTQVQSVIVDHVNQKINELTNGNDIKAIIFSRINENLHHYTPDLSQFENSLQDVGTQIINRLNTTADAKINEIISTRISSVDVDEIIYSFISSKLDKLSDHFPFKDRSIAGSAISAAGLKITGDNIEGGVVKRFASTGIDDQASQCQLTILDQGAVFENTLYAGKLEVKGGATIDGDLTILGQLTETPAYEKLVLDTGNSVLSQIGASLLDQHQDRVFDRIREEGMDLSKITFGGKVVIDGNKLTTAITESYLQSLGVVRDLQTRGENLLSDTLYVSANRVGVNTLEPSSALSVWDEEIEIGFGKHSQGVARVGTSRDQTLILSSNKQNNITLTPDGVTTVPQLRIGNMLFSSSATPPHYDAPRGTVVFNEQPNLGGPLGWTSLGDAKWANFGIID